ncbi:hypothetical protein Tsubulata_039161 [Turnera subulata]|uniref:Sulfotransferase n=1 Tax=Turnera subulata TaxID=218843 RepID=A0A9Q0J6G4_9ROSI|nr:hypothetical protein Tsubulata_039161 [Turnera subulata]
MEEVEKEKEDELLSSLPKIKAWQMGFWYPPHVIHALATCQEHFEAQNTDTIVATFPKAGTTWMKALSFAVLTRAQHSPSQSPLLSTNPHDLVPYLELKLYKNKQIPDLSALSSSPRIFAVHVPYQSLPESVKNSACKIVYLGRNPLDTFVSFWHFLNKSAGKGGGETLPLEECFDDFCQGVVACGPFFDHVLGYWKQSLERPDKEDPSTQLKRLAEFLGCPFSVEEERDGVIQEITKLCSFNVLKDMEHNKTGKSPIANFDNTDFFRRGVVGDWINFLTPEMGERLSNIMEQKLAGSGLGFKIRPQ